jgi:hypothetical protein
VRDSLAEIARIPAVGAGDIAGDAYQLIAKLAMLTKEAKLTQIFAWGFKAWMTQQPAGYSLSGYIDGREFGIVTDLPQEAERAFVRAARSAWLRRKVRVLRGLPARESQPVNSLDTYHEISLREIFVAVVTALWSRVFR